MKKFTLIELLVVVAIIGILASLLLPVLGKSRKTAQRVTCVSSMIQILKGMAMFQDDNDGIIAHNYNANRFQAMDWPLGIDPYLGGQTSLDTTNGAFKSQGAANIWWDCSSTTGTGQNIDTQYTSIDYGMASGGPRWSYLGYNINEINKTNQNILLSDIYHITGETDKQGYVSLRTDFAYDKQTGATAGKYKHDRSKANQAFFDGHVSSLPWLPQSAFVSLYLEDLYNLPNIDYTNSTKTYELFNP